jgi:transposase
VKKGESGRKSKYTPDRIDKITKAIGVGATYTHACNYAGIDLDTFARWRKKYADFAEAIKEAEGKAVIGWLAKIEKAASDGNWTAAAWKLERRYPEDYGRKEKLEHANPDGSALLAPLAEAMVKVYGGS